MVRWPAEHRSWPSAPARVAKRVQNMNGVGQGRNVDHTVGSNGAADFNFTYAATDRWHWLPVGRVAPATKRQKATKARTLAMLASSNAFATEQTVTLVVKNMYCAACPQIVKANLQAVPSVKQAVVSYKEKTAVVTGDDVKTDVKALITATRNAGYPSAPKG